jgi:DNA-damage-inducible protein J
MDTKKAIITARVSMKTKEQARKVFESVGLDMTTAINIFLKKSIAANGIPFSVTAIDPLDAATMKAHKQIENGEYEEFDNLEDLLKDLHDED